MRRALITGTSTGIGRAAAIRLAIDGFDVVAAMRDPVRGEAGLREAADEAGVGERVSVVALDVDRDDSVASAVGAVGPVDVLVNNAGTSPVGAVEEFPLAEWKQLFETNVFGVLRCIQAVLPAMRARGTGTIVNVSSVVGRAVLPAFGPYAASKWAVEALSEALAIEVRPFGVRVVVVEPGATRTAIQEKTGMPPRHSVYRETAKNWGFAVGWDHARASPPEVVADAIARAVTDPDAPLRIPVGQGCAESIALRARHDDEAWVRLWSAPTAEFLDRYRALTGVDLADRSG